MRHVALASVLLVMAACTQGGDRTQSIAASGDHMFGTDANLAPSAPDAVPRYAKHSRGFAELRLPRGDGPFPLAVIFHGGCWKAGIANQAYMAPLATQWQDQGIATLNVDYREVGDGGGWPGSFADWSAAARLIDEVATAHPIDRARVTLVGHSAGALPAQWLAMEQDADGPLGARGAVTARAAIVFDGPADVGGEQAAFDALCEFSAVDPFVGARGAERTNRLAAISPLGHAPKLEQLLFVQAVLPAPSSRVQVALRARGAVLEVSANPGVSHFAIITPGHDAYLANEHTLMRVLRGQ